MTRINLDEGLGTSGIKFYNYGDVNFADGGCLVGKDRDNSYWVIKCDYLYDAETPTWVFSEDCIDITDDWIDREAVEQFAGCNRDEEPECFARAVIDYYGTQSYGEEMLSAKEAEERLNSYDVVDEVYWDSSDFE